MSNRCRLSNLNDQWTVQNVVVYEDGSLSAGASCEHPRGMYFVQGTVPDALTADEQAHSRSWQGRAEMVLNGIVPAYAWTIDDSGEEAMLTGAQRGGEGLTTLCLNREHICADDMGFWQMIGQMMANEIAGSIEP